MNKKMKMKMCSMLLGLALFAACSSDDDVVTPQPKSYPLTIEVSENPLIPEGGAASAAATRAAITTLSTLDGFTMTYLYKDNDNELHTGSATAEKDKDDIGNYIDGKWTYKGTWPSATIDAQGNPENEQMVTWYASTITSKAADVTFQANSDDPYIRFIQEEQVNTQHDLLVAKTADVYHNNNGAGHLYFAFDHACSALALKVKKAKNLENYTLKISNITLHNVVKEGKYYYETGTGTRPWELTSERANYTIYNGSELTLSSITDYTTISGDYNKENEHYIFFIPQKLEAWDGTTAFEEATTKTYLSMTCTITDSDSHEIHKGTAYIPFAAVLEKGTQYEVKINIGKTSLYSGPNTKIF